MTGEEISLTDDDTAPTGSTLTANPDTVAENVQTAPTVTGRTRYVAKKTVAVGADPTLSLTVAGTDYQPGNNLTIKIAASTASGTGTYNDHVNGLARFCTVW